MVVVLTWRGAEIHSEDVAILDNTQAWVNDHIITFYFEHIGRLVNQKKQLLAPAPSLPSGPAALPSDASSPPSESNGNRHDQGQGQGPSTAASSSSSNGHPQRSPINAAGSGGSPPSPEQVSRGRQGLSCPEEEVEQNVAAGVVSSSSSSALAGGGTLASANGGSTSTLSPASRTAGSNAVASSSGGSGDAPEETRNGDVSVSGASGDVGSVQNEPPPEEVSSRPLQEPPPEQPDVLEVDGFSTPTRRSREQQNIINQGERRSMIHAPLEEDGVLESDVEEKHLFIGAEASFWLRQESDEDDLAQTIDSLGIFSPDRVRVYFPLNNNSDSDVAGGGTHWSLLCFELPGRGRGEDRIVSSTSGVWRHFDSGGSMNFPVAVEFATKLSRFFTGSSGGSGEAPHIVQEKVPQQANNHDCGLYTICFAELIAATTSDQDTRGSLDTLTPLGVTRKRLEIKELIQNYVSEQGKR
ncbi:unnamed protein product [Amoebophrya sp. A25]|nr:unnamed protein product [Amoebophrya sp. A25]|eukprot:GSA25T00019854001.1